MIAVVGFEIGEGPSDECLNGIACLFADSEDEMQIYLAEVFKDSEYAYYLVGLFVDRT